jgi:hypothetical protein
VARRGAGKLGEEVETGSASAAWRATTGHQPEEPPEAQEEWVDLGRIADDDEYYGRFEDAFGLDIRPTS